MGMLFRQFLLNWKLFLREKSAVFWTLIFPVLMLVAFGLIFRQGSTPATKLVWVQGGDPAAEARLEQGLQAAQVKVERVARPEAETRWSKGETALQMEPAGTGFRLRVNAYLAAQGLPAAQGVQQAWLLAEARAQGAAVEPLPFVLESPGHKRAGNYTAFLLPGILGMNLLSMGLYAVGMVNVFNREKGIFRRLAVTPLPKGIFILAQVLQRLVVFAVQTALLLAVAQVFFHVENQGSWFAFSLILVLGAACFMALGFALASFTKTHESFAAVSNAFFFPMMLFSGVYFSLDSAPRWMQHAAQVLPLSPFLKVLRAIFNDGGTLAQHGFAVGLVALWAVAAFTFAVKKFRWT